MKTSQSSTERWQQVALQMVDKAIFEGMAQKLDTPAEVIAEKLCYEFIEENDCNFDDHDAIVRVVFPYFANSVLYFSHKWGFTFDSKTTLWIEREGDAFGMEIKYILSKMFSTAKLRLDRK